MISPHIMTLLLKDMLVPTDNLMRRHTAIEIITLEFFKAKRRDHLNDKFKETFSIEIDANDSLADTLYKMRSFIDSAIIEIANKTKAIDFYDRVKSAIACLDEKQRDVAHNAGVLSYMFYDVSIAQYDKTTPSVFTFYLYIDYTINEFSY